MTNGMSESRLINVFVTAADDSLTQLLGSWEQRHSLVKTENLYFRFVSKQTGEEKRDWAVPWFILRH